METHYNIYERIEIIEKELCFLREKAEHYEYLLQFDHNKKINDKNDLEGFFTINEILLKYSISRQCFFNYRKLVSLKKSARIGRFDRFKKKKVVDFMNKITELKKSNPELFKLSKSLENRLNRQ